LTKLIQIIYI